MEFSYREEAELPTRPAPPRGYQMSAHDFSSPYPQGVLLRQNPPTVSLLNPPTVSLLNERIQISLEYIILF